MSLLKRLFPLALVVILPPLFSIALSGTAVRSDSRLSVAHSLGVADPAAALELVLGVLSGSGRAVLNEGANSLVVLDEPQVQDRVREIVAALQQPLFNVKVESRFVDRETGKEAGMGAAGQILLSFPDTSPEGGVYFRVEGKESKRSAEAAQSIVVSSGREATISVGRHIPYEQWFYSYGERLGLISKELVWREAGTRLTVRPTVVAGGEQVRLRVVPEIDYAVRTGRRKGERREAVAFAAAATEVTVANGEEVRIGGVEGHEEFYDRFLVGYDRQRRVRSLDIFIRATILP